MSQKDERAKAIDKVRKLRDRLSSTGSSESEVEFAMRTMGDLMDTFDITMDEVSLAAEECKTVINTHNLGSVFHLGTVAVAVANFCDCVTYRSQDRKVQKRDKQGNLVFGKNARGRLVPHYEKPTYTSHFFGIESDAETACYLMDLVRGSLVKALADFKKTEQYKTYSYNKTALTKSFVEGYANRMVWRLNDLKARREAELEQARQAREEMGEGSLDAERAAAERRAGRSTDLVALKDKKVKDDFKAKHGWEVKYRSRSSGGGTWAGRGAGGSAAEKVNLSRPVGNGGGYSGQRLLG
jgi:hypothetical protein